MGTKTDKEYLEILQDDILNLFYEAVDSNLLNLKYCGFYIKTMNSQQRASEIRQHRIDEGLPAPPIMVCSVTSRCNLYCPGCYLNARNNNGNTEVSLERLDRLFTEAYEIGTRIIFLAGGEPLLRHDILELAAKHNEIIFPVFTDGLLLDTGKVRFFNKNKNLVPVLNLDWKETGINVHRDQGLYSGPESVIEILRRQKMLFGLTLTLAPDNCRSVLDKKKLQEFYDQGCRIFFYTEKEAGRPEEIQYPQKPEQLQDIRDKMKMLRKEIPAFHISLSGGNDKYGGCLAGGRGFVHISTDGKLEPCPFAPYSDTEIMDTPLATALDSGLLKSVRNHHHLLSDRDQRCLLTGKREIVERQLGKSSVPGAHTISA